MDEETKKPHLVILPKPEGESEPEDEPEAPEPAPEEPEEEPEAPEGEPQEQEEEPEEPDDDARPNRLHRVTATVFTILLVILAALVFVFRDRLTGENLRDTFGILPAQQVTVREDFTYDVGAGQTFAAAGNGLAVATGSSLQLMNAAGRTAFKQVVSYTDPAVFATESKAMFCDLGGTGCVTARLDGTSAALTAKGTLQSADMNENGWIALTTDATGYKGLVSVYDDEGAERYEYWSGAGYVLKAAVSPDNRTLAVLCAESGGGKLHIFRLDSANEHASYAIGNALPFDFCFMGNDRVCLVGTDALRFVSTEGEEAGVFDLGDYYLVDYDLDGQGFIALYVSAYRAGGGLVETVDRDGKLLAYADLERDALSLSASGRRLLVMTGGGLTVYDQNLKELYHSEALMTAKDAILRADGAILLLGSFSAQKISY